MFNVQALYHQQMSIGGLEAFRDSLGLLGIDIRDYPEHQFFLLDYNQINAVKNHPVVNECRGLLMAYDGSIIRKGFTRFYNLGENGVDQFDFENSIVFEKADGSLMFVYWCPPTNRWEIGTRGTAFAEGPNEWHGTFRNFMLNAMGRTEEQFQNDAEEYMWKDQTYLFEAVGPDNRIVTKYETNHLIYLSSVDNNDGTEDVCDEDLARVIPEAFFEWNVRPINSYKFRTQEECIEALHALTGLQEGYVAMNTKTGLRVKIKSPTYLAAHRLRGNNGLTVNSICELVVMNEYDEYLAVFPEDAGKFGPALAVFSTMLADLAVNYTTHKHLESQKDFALAVKDLHLSAVMFKARSNKTDTNHEFNQFPMSRRADWLKERLIKLNGEGNGVISG